MTGHDLLGLLRSLLHDTGRGMATSARFYDDDVLLRGLNLAICEVSAALIVREPRASITLSRLLKVVAVTPGFPGSAVPSDFWQMECGYDTSNNNRYIPADTVTYGERTAQFETGKVYAKGGFVNGNANHIVYWSLPPLVTDSSATLTTFPDALYHVAKLKAAADLVAQEDHDALDRWQALSKDFEKAIETLR